MLTKKEQKEPMYMTWGRIKTRCLNYTSDKRLHSLVKKFDKDMDNAKVEENYETKNS